LQINPSLSNKKIEKTARGRTLLPLIFLLLIFCLLFIAIFWVFLRLPGWAEKEFGPSASYLTAQQKYIYSLRLFLARKELQIPLSAESSPKNFTIQLGESVTSISTRLEDEGFIRDWEAIRLYLIYSGLDLSIQAGDFELSPSMTAIEIANKIQDSTPIDVDFVILPGWRAEEIAATLPSSGLNVTSEDFLSIVLYPELISIPEKIGPVRSLEGFLYPGTYTIKRDVGALELVQIFVNRFASELPDEFINAYAEKGLSLQDAVIMASMVEREAVIDEEKPMIASVFYNRLAIQMKLESDPTVQYGIGYNEIQQTWWTNPLSSADISNYSLYNTYINIGLPPTPICNPDFLSLQAVAYPEQSDYYYFQADCNGSGNHNFARTFEEHLQNSCQE